MGVVGMLRFTNAGSVNLPWAFTGHSFSSLAPCLWRSSCYPYPSPLPPI